MNNRTANKTKMTPRKTLNRYARDRRVAIVDCAGVNRENLYDAKQMIDEFETMARSGGDFALDIIESPETGIALYVVWADKSQMSYAKLLKVASGLFDSVRDAHAKRDRMA